MHPYQPFQRDRLEQLEREIWFQELAEHIRPQAESHPYVTDPTRVSGLPKEVQALYFLWMFYCEVGANGIETFLLEPLGNWTPQAHEALRLVGVSKLVERLEAGIPHALASGSAEFSAGPNLEWFRHFPPNPNFPTLQSVDVDIYDLVGDELRDKANTFIETHRDVLTK
jgi:hypothetical protein